MTPGRRILGRAIIGFLVAAAIATLVIPYLIRSGAMQDEITGGALPGMLLWFIGAIIGAILAATIRPRSTQ